MELLPSDVEAQTFRVAKKGYDPDEVHEFLKRVGRQMSTLEERAKIAAVRADQLERKARELEQSQSNVADAYRDALETRKRLIREAEEEAGRIRDSDGDGGDFHAPTMEHAELEGQRIVAQAKLEAERTHTAAETVLQRALAASDRIETETQRILDEAREDAETIRDEARVEAEALRSDAAAQLAEQRTGLEDDQRDLIRRVRALQAEVAALEAQRDAAAEAPPVVHEPAAAEAAVTDEPTDAPTPEPAAPRMAGGPLREPMMGAPASLDTATEVVVDVRDEDAVAVDLAETDEESPEPARKQSRYMSRSAKLPHIGDNAGSVLGSMKSLRKKAD